MDWTQVVITFITSGAFLALFTIRERKTEMMLNNSAKLNDGWMQLANERQEMLKEKDKKLEEKDAKIDELYRISSSLRHMLDDANTARAVAEVLLCDKADCTKRNPPFGSHLHLECRGCKDRDKGYNEFEEEEAIEENIR